MSLERIVRQVSRRLCRDGAVYTLEKCKSCAGHVSLATVSSDIIPDLMYRVAKKRKVINQSCTGVSSTLKKEYILIGSSPEKE